MTTRKKSYTKIAFTLSICLLMIWALLGTGTTIAWFTDTSEIQKNTFFIGDLDLVVSHKLEDGTYEEIKSDTKVFDEEALYEPGYVQVVYLKVENKGTVPFDFKTAVNVTDYTEATNKFGQTFHLQKFLKFGLVMADTEDELEKLVETRDLAAEKATLPLNNYSSDVAELEAKGEMYIALIVRMPEEVGDEANYRGEVIPRVELGLIFSAEQQKN